MNYTYALQNDTLTRTRNEQTLSRLEDRHIDPPSAGADDWYADEWSDFDEPEPWELFIGESADDFAA